MNRQQAETLYMNLYTQLTPRKKREFDAYLIDQGGKWDQPMPDMPDEILSDTLEVLDDMVTGGDATRDYQIV